MHIILTTLLSLALLVQGLPPPTNLNASPHIPGSLENPPVRRAGSASQERKNLWDATDFIFPLISGKVDSTYKIPGDELKEFSGKFLNGESNTLVGVTSGSGIFILQVPEKTMKSIYGAGGEIDPSRGSNKDNTWEQLVTKIRESSGFRSILQTGFYEKYPCDPKSYADFVDDPDSIYPSEYGFVGP